MPKRLTNVDIRNRKGSEPIVSVTAYDFWGARMAQEAGVDFILVGDSLGNVIQGLDTTLPVTVDEVVYHTKAVVRGAAETFVVADMPFMSFHVSVADTVTHAGRFLKEAGAQAVKIEGGRRRNEMIAACVNAEIPVMGHIGLTPQSVVKFGGYKVQRDEDHLLDEARAVEEAGAFAIVLECVPTDIAARITAAVSIPTIGIGAGAATDGQILVWHDILGMSQAPKAKFVKTYGDLFQDGVIAMRIYGNEVRQKTFPDAAHSYLAQPTEEK
jgi:3-methyl-2-oxobutanoate hydroxymethyltransferase